MQDIITRAIYIYINLTPKGIYTKLGVSHQYGRQMGPTCVKSHEQNVPHKLYIYFGVSLITLYTSLVVKISFILFASCVDSKD